MHAPGHLLGASRARRVAVSTLLEFLQSPEQKTVERTERH